MATFNPNELIFDRIRAVEEYDLATNELLRRYTQVKEPNLQTSKEGQDVTDALGAPIHTFYRNPQGTFSFTNALHSLDLMASQFGTTKNIGSAEKKQQIPVSETLEIASDNTVTLSYVPVGVKGAEIKYVKIITQSNTFGETYTLSPSIAEGSTFTLNAAEKKITLPTGVTGRVFVNYTRETEKGASISYNAEGDTQVVKLLIHAIFRDPCNSNIVYAGVIQCPRAQIDPTSIDVNLASDAGHAASYKLRKPYCDDSSKVNLFDILVAGE